MTSTPSTGVLPHALTHTQQAMLRGLRDARQIMNLVDHTEMMQLSPGPMPGTVPMSREKREEWLIAYATGIKLAVSGQEVPVG